LSHTTVSKTAVPLRSTEPKLSPLTVTELPPLNGPFCTHADPTAASKLYAALAVPARPPTLTADMPYIVIAMRLRHASAVAEIHDDVRHAAISSAAVPLRSEVPKLNPLTVTNALPVIGVFSVALLSTAASKLNIVVHPVPTKTEIVTSACTSAEIAEPVLHATVVDELHVAVAHTPSASWTVPVGSACPKPSPITATHPPPVIGAFAAALPSALLTTGGSKLYAALAVPTRPPTLTADMPYISIAVRLRHTSVVAELHDDVLQTTISSALVPLRSTEPKLSPLTVTELPPLQAPFRTQPDPTAASKLYPSNCVPVGPPTVTATLDVCAAGTATALDAHPKLVAELHDEVSHAP
jgi:hypothetical protein